MLVNSTKLSTEILAYFPSKNLKVLFPSQKCIETSSTALLWLRNELLFIYYKTHKHIYQFLISKLI